MFRDLRDECFGLLLQYWVMSTPSGSMRDLAGRLLAIEAANPLGDQPHVQPAVRVCQKLRGSLIRFAGVDGFTSLLRRAVALAKTEYPSLSTLQIKLDGSLEGLTELAAETRGGRVDSPAALAITTHLLALLVTFVGRPLTLRLVRDAWPDELSDSKNELIEERK